MYCYSHSQTVSGNKLFKMQNSLSLFVYLDKILVHIDVLFNAPPLTKRWSASLDFRLYLPLHNPLMSIQHCPRGKHVWLWLFDRYNLVDERVHIYWYQISLDDDRQYSLSPDFITRKYLNVPEKIFHDYRRYSYSPDSAVEDSARPSMSSTLPLPRSLLSS